MKKILIVFLFVLFLSGCEYFEETPNNQLAAPENVRYVDHIITFDAVEHADRYQIVIDGIVHMTTSTSYSFTEKGEFMVYIQAFGEGYEPSDFSELSIYNPHDLMGPTNLMLIDGILSYDEVPGAYRYEIDFDYHGQTYTTDTIVDVSMYTLLYGSYLNIKVRALFNVGASNYSETLQVIDGKPIIKRLLFNYSQVSSSDMTIFTEEDRFSVRSVYDENLLAPLSSIHYVTGSDFAFKSSYFDSLEVGTYYYTIETHRGYVQLVVNVNSDALPYLINASEVYVDFTKDLSFTFDLMGGEILSLTAKDLEITDYTIDGSQVTIDVDYLKTIFSEYGRVYLIVRYELKLGHESVIGYIKLTDNT